MKRITHIIEKCFNRSCMIINSFYLKSQSYSIKYGIYDFLWWLGFYLRIGKLTRKYNQKKQDWLDLYIEKKYNNIIKEYINAKESKTAVQQYNIWVFWGQGANKMPQLVNLCYRQLKKNNPNNVILLDLNNIAEYIQIPQFVYTKLEKGELLYAHFSDILRNSLLAKYGGLWLDATCWTAHPVPKMVYENAFYSPHNEQEGTYWCTYAMGSNLIESVTFSFVRDMLLAVCENEKVWPDYLFQDRLLSFAHRKLSASQKSINLTPQNSTKRFLLYTLLNKPFDNDYYQKLIATDWLFKLSYKSYYKMENNGKQTFYAAVLAQQ